MTNDFWDGAEWMYHIFCDAADEAAKPKTGDTFYLEIINSVIGYITNEIRERMLRALNRRFFNKDPLGYTE